MSMIDRHLTILEDLPDGRIRVAFMEITATGPVTTQDVGLPDEMADKYAPCIAHHLDGTRQFLEAEDEE